MCCIYRNNNLMSANVPKGDGSSIHNNTDRYTDWSVNIAVEG